MILKPCSVIVAGPSGSGKSELVEQLFKDKKLFHPPPKKIVYCSDHDRWQPRFDRMKKQSKVKFYKGLPPVGALAKWFKPQDHGISVLDDLIIITIYTFIWRLSLCDPKRFTISTNSNKPNKILQRLIC